MMGRNIYLFFLLLSFGLSVRGASNYTFSSDFLFGTATASYQIEGAWNESRGETIWDHLTHENPELITDRSNGDIACDSYHRYQEDIALLVNLGVDFYRFSIAWSRIFPSGHPYNLNSEGVAYYNNLINALIARNITPMVTIYHWDLPQRLQVLGGWTNPSIVTWFTEYARVLLENYSDRVKYWITFNEPYQVCQQGYGGILKAPVLDMPGRADYLCTHNLLKSHAAVYHLFNNTYRSRNDGKMGITLSAVWFEPNTTNDAEAAERGLQFRVGIYTNPIFSASGDYPEVVKRYVADRSRIEGYSRSRLPTFTTSEIEYIRGTYDFFGLNHYTTFMVAHANATGLETSIANDEQLTTWTDTSWPTDQANRFGIVPWGFRNLLVWIKERYNSPEIHITENGCADNGGTNDTVRVSYYGQYLESLLEAINEHNVTVKSYAAWSLMDNFEWMFGYTYRYGIHSVDFTDPNRPRTPKLSADFLRNVIATRTVGNYTVV